MVVATSEDAPARRSSPNRRIAELAPTAVSALAIAVSFVGYLLANRRLWFFGDDWDFLLERPLTHNTMHSLFAPHNEHWSTVPVLTFRLLYSLFGLHHYLVFEAPVLLLHVGSCIVLWTLMRRAGATPWATAGGVVLIALCGGGSENLLWDFQLGFVGSVFFGLLAILIADADTLSRRRLIWTWVALLLSLMSSGIGVPMVVAASVSAGLKHGRRAAFTTVSVPAAVFVVWFLTYGHKGEAHDNTTLSARLKSAQFVWQGLTNTWQVNTSIPNSGALILGAITIPVLMFGLRDRLGRLAMGLLSGEIGLFVLTGWSRVHLGISQADAPRYVYISTMLTIVAAVWSTSALVRVTRRWVPEHRPAPIVAGVVLAVLLTLVAMSGSAYSFYTNRKKLVHTSETSILAAVALIRHGAPSFASCCPDGHYSPNVSVALLSRPGVLSAMPSFTLTPAQEITTRGVLQVGVRAGSHAAQMNGTVTMRSTGQSLGNGESLCLVGTADSNHPVVVTDAGGRATVIVSTSGPLFTQLDYNGLISPVSTSNAPSALGGAGAVTVTMSQPGATLLVYTIAGKQFSVCRS